MENKRHKIKVEVVFEGHVWVDAVDFENAINTLKDNFGVVLGEVSTSENEHIIDWDLGIHPENYIPTLVESKEIEED